MSAGATSTATSGFCPTSRRLRFSVLKSTAFIQSELTVAAKALSTSIICEKACGLLSMKSSQKSFLCTEQCRTQFSASSRMMFSSCNTTTGRKRGIKKRRLKMGSGRSGRYYTTHGSRNALPKNKAQMRHIFRKGKGHLVDTPKN